jgi:lysophospholipase L1-like esterase
MNEQSKGARAPFLLPKKVNSMKFQHPRLILVLLSSILSILALEGILTLTDPIGINRYQDDVRQYYNSLIQTDEGLFVLPDGVHVFSNWTATIKDGRRITADNVADCAIAVIGDSMTFGLGVNDSDVWVTRLAQNYPTVDFRNYAYSGYDVRNLQAVFEQAEADAYIYLIIFNDVGAGITKLHHYPPSHTWTLGRYLGFSVQVWLDAQSSTVVTDEYRAYLEAIPENTLIVGFENEVLAEYAAQHHGAILIPPYTERISASDIHPNGLGHQQIADSLLPLVAPFVTRICHEPHQ